MLTIERWLRMFSNIKAVIFDLDGTLIDSMWLWKAIDIEYLKKFGYDLPDSLQNDIEGMSFTETAQYFKSTFNIPNTIEEIKAEWNKMAEEYYLTRVKLKDNVEHIIKYLNTNNIKTGIGTSNSRELVSLIVNRYNLANCFQSIRTSCEVKKGKPHPDIFLKVAEDLGVKPEECLVFEDIPNGIMAGKNAGMKVCAIYDDFSKHLTDEKISLADYYIEGYDQILNNKMIS